MKRNWLYYLLVLHFIFLINACDQAGNLFLINGYEYDVIVYSVYDHNNTIIERTKLFSSEESFAVAARNIQYRHIIVIRIETQDGHVLAEYTPEYIESLRKIYIKKKNQQEFWIFNEKGLFFQTKEINNRFMDKEKILAYYRSDEAVQDLQALLRENNSN